MYVCVCKSVTHAEIVERVRTGTGCFDALQFETGVSSCCGRCEDTARALVAETLRAQAPAAPAAAMAGDTSGPCACGAAPGAECVDAAAAGATPAVGASAAGAPRLTAISRRLPISARSM